MPLTPEEVDAFVKSLRTWRDMSIVSLMLFCGLRSREIIELTLRDLNLQEGIIRIRGKGDKDRMIPLSPRTGSLLKTYLEVERPNTKEEKLFVLLKGPRRGQAMTVPGLRSLFRYHRKRSKVTKANAHRWRHTFGSDMAAAGISLPSLMKLMGHADIQTTMLYVMIQPRDVSKEFHRVITEKLKRRYPLKKDDASQTNNPE
jgi:integrase